MDTTKRLIMENLYAVITVGRQVDGEYIFIKTEKVFKSAQKADSFLRGLKSKFVTEDGKWKPQVISTPNGDATCQLEAGVFEIEVDNE
jgi:hypothetical protein